MARKNLAGQRGEVVCSLWAIADLRKHKPTHSSGRRVRKARPAARARKFQTKLPLSEFRVAKFNASFVERVSAVSA
jgi:hypothetical protein